MHGIEVVGISNIPEVEPGADVGALILEACRGTGLAIVDGDVVVVTQKIVSKAEGNIVPLASIEPSPLATQFATSAHKEPRLVELALREAQRIVRMDVGILITETRDGLVCANSGVDASNVGIADAATTLPNDPDGSADTLRQTIEAGSSATIALIVSDTFGRPWREGVVNVAIGVSGMKALIDYRGKVDAHGRSLASTVIAVADELAGAAELVMGKVDHIPVAIVRGFAFEPGGGGARALVRDRAHDLFR